jgi:hypothetical protein
MGGGFCPGRCDRSHSTRCRLLMAGLARSAWDSATQTSRPVGYGLIRAGLRTDLMIGVSKFRIRQHGIRREIRRNLRAAGPRADS